MGGALHGDLQAWMPTDSDALKRSSWGVFIFKPRVYQPQRAAWDTAQQALLQAIVEVFLIPYFQVQRESQNKWFMSPLQCHTSSISFQFNLFKEEMESAGNYVQKYINVLIWLEI